MPKVTGEYLLDKKKYILECTTEILSEKPLYLVTMRDIIKKANFSHGVIYRYYPNLDEIFVDLINSNTTSNLLEQRIDEILISKQPERIILSNCIIATGEYMDELLKSVGGKIFYELVVYYSYDFEKRASVLPRLMFKQSFENAKNKIVEYAMNNIDKGIFNPQIPAASIIMFVSSFIDGIAQSVAINKAEKNEQTADLTIDIPEIFQILAKAVINFLDA